MTSPYDALAEECNELGWVRLELEILTSARMLAPLSEAVQARFVELARRERELLRHRDRPDRPSSEAS